MTKKEELLLFIDSNVDKTNNIKLNTVLQGNNENCELTICVVKTRLVEIITENFNDDLVGSMPYDLIIHKVSSWETCERR